MKKQQEKFVIGEKPSIIAFFILFILYLFLDLIFANFLATTLVKIFGVKELENLIFILCSILFLLFQFPSFIGGYEHWEVNNLYIKYYPTDGYFKQLKSTFDVFLNREGDAFAIKINIASIKEIELFWTKQRAVFGFGYMEYSIHIAITLTDDSIVTYNAALASPYSKNQFIKALNYLKSNHNIIIKDVYDLLAVIANPKLATYDYLRELEKKLNDLNKSVVDKYD